MKHHVRATPAPAPKTDNIRGVSLLLAAIILLMAVAQLFSYEKFPDLIGSFWLPGGDFTAKLLAAVIVIVDVFALPFLLRMRLSPLMRVVSMVCGWLVVAIWFALSLWVNLATTGATNAGLLGATVSLPVGWWMVSLLAGVGVLTGWTSWGMWPLDKAYYAEHRQK